MAVSCRPTWFLNMTTEPLNSRETAILIWFWIEVSPCKPLTPEGSRAYRKRGAKAVRHVVGSGGHHSTLSPMSNLPGVRVALTLPLDVRDRLGQIADREHRTMSQQVAFWVEQASAETTTEKDS